MPDMHDTTPRPDIRGEACRRRTRRTRWVVTAIALAVTGTAVVAVVRATGGDERTAAAQAEVQAFLDAWAAGEPARAARHTDDPRQAESLLTSVTRGLHPEKARFTLEGETSRGEDRTVTVPFTAALTLDGIGEWSYRSEAVAEPDGDGWSLRWEPSVVHPELGSGSTLVLTTDEAERAPVLAADGSTLAGPSTVWDISIWPAKLTDPERAYEALGDPALGADLDIPKLRRRVDAAGPDEAVPVVTLRDAVYQRNKAPLLPIPGLQFRDAERPLALAARSLVGAVDQASGKGVSGLQSRYDKQLAGDRRVSVVVADRESGAPGRTLTRKGGGKKGSPVRTTIRPAVQAAAEQALEGMDKNASIVAIEPSSGEIVAVADNPPSGLNRSLTGKYPPGSTFKVVTATALLERGATAGTPVSCPRYSYVNGQRFENQDEFELPVGTTFEQAFARSCNTAFVEMRDKLDDDTLTTTAEAFGIGGEWQVGAATYDGSVPVHTSDNDKAAAAIGQGKVETSPLVMASVAATVKAGGFRQPVLVPDAVRNKHRAPSALGADTLNEVRSMMRAVVTEGAGRALKDLPNEPHAKTGTAEFGTGTPPRTHAWMIGYLGRGDLAFSVLVEDGGSGGKDAGPVAARFLSALG